MSFPAAARVALFATLSFALAACETLPTTGRATLSAAAAPAYALAGSGSPAVVLQAGLGDGKATWEKVFDPLSRSGQVFAYDRPGYGDSAWTDGPRDPCTVARELHATLQVAGVKPPYILVGHSLGGLYQYAYAKLYPSEVAGLVLLDPTHPRHLARLQADNPTMAAAAKGMNMLTMSAAARREFADQAECVDGLNQSVPLAMPVRLLASGKRDFMETAGYAATLDKLRQDWLKLTGAARVEVQPSSTHYLQKDVPDAVIAAVNDLRRAPKR
ncbi:alpha/beta fold hydrolase [Oxalobacteraceae bacterium A2-2]